MENSKPLVSVIMNCHNGGHFLEEAINSVYSQTYKKWEIIFLDNASNDKSRNIAESFNNKLKYFYINKKIPLGRARNIALSKAKGEFIAFLDCDDTFLENKLYDQVILMKDDKFDMCFGSCFHIDQNSNVIKRKKVQNKSGNLFATLLKNYNINMQTIMIRQDFIKKFNLQFDESLLFAPDYDLFMEIALIGNSISLKRYLVNYRIHSNSLTNKSQHLVCLEGIYTLERIMKKYSEVRAKYRFEFRYAKSVFKLQEAIHCLQLNDLNQAKKELKEGPLVNFKTLILLFLIYLNISPRFILILIGRGK
jgi:glycosyltransferase involved in cell wall biosynthesis